MGSPTGVGRRPPEGWTPGDGGPPWGYGRPWGTRGPGHGLPAVLAVVVALVQLIGCSWANGNHGDMGRTLDGLGYALLVAGPVAMLARRALRVPVLVVVIAVTVAYYLLYYPSGPFFLAAVATLVGAVRSGHRLGATVVAAGAWLAVIVTGHFVHTIGGVPVRSSGVVGAVVLATWIAVPLVVGEGIRTRSARIVEVARARAEQARARAEQQRRQASEERLQIARELHDVLGHHLSLINVQAGVGLHLMDERPEQARVALAAIKQASAEALREVRSVLGVLRPEDEKAPRAPAPSLANLDDLVATAGARLVVHGQRTELPAELDRAAYRIVQEALTNVRRHAGADATATVTIGYGSDGLTLVIEDNGRGAAAEPDGDGADGNGADGNGADGNGADGNGADGNGADGNGIAGMRARATALGGELTAGPVPAGGFRVEARLPWEGR